MDQDDYNAAYEAGRTALFQEMRDYALKCEKENQPIKVTVIWNDCFCDGMSDHRAELVEIRERADGNLYIDGIVRQAMRNYGHTEDMVNEAISKSYGLVGIIKGKVEWLA